MPTGHPAKRTLTDNRRRLLTQAAEGGVKRAKLPAPDRTQMNALVAFGWLKVVDGIYVVTAAGEAQLGK